MKKFYRIFLLLILFIFTTTYNPNKFDFISENNNKFFKIQKVVITGNFLVEKNHIYKKLEKIYNKNIFFIKRKDLEDSLKNINFLEKIEVKKKYPNTVIVKIFETKPMGFIYKNNVKYLLDSSSNLILLPKHMDFDRLPNIFGDGAEINLVNFLNRLEINNFPKQEIKNMYYFQIERWDLQLLDDKIIKFPHKATDKIIKKSIDLLNRKDFENYNIIDLRVDGKIIVE